MSRKVLYALINYDPQTHKPVRVFFSYTDGTVEDFYPYNVRFQAAYKRAMQYLRR